MGEGTGGGRDRTKWVSLLLDKIFSGNATPNNNVHMQD